MNPAMYDANDWEDELQWEVEINGLLLCPDCNNKLLLGFSAKLHCPLYMCYHCGWARSA